MNLCVSEDAEDQITSFGKLVCLVDIDRDMLKSE